ncbi:glycosyltransferase family 2 protein [Beggiatoa leptomitoformis]|uniref:Glycosyltransferase n=1 Tax=Beggiatoa leptomitoformis TaxID=288004 RepID=A0A2N9YHG9_9GAMM|nr:glycosyltransferase family 2 protein [Beggiatoa leptomitoformis]ALG68044.1 glycosyltransferase [Beggiatoa leptomitoformis]AUI69666.1 glycosyltransferase [Beggiatoa leptomitoformis]
MLSVILITKNAAPHIDRCLTAVRWADEIIVVDSGSTDDTLIRCSAYTKHVFIHTDWQGFGVQKNRALQYATGDWVLSVDADEEVTPILQQAILEAMQNQSYSAWQLPRLSRYCGRWMRHGGWYPDYVTRLFKRGTAQFSNDLVHEKLMVSQGKIGQLTTPLLHYSFANLEEVLQKINAYSSASAQMQFARGKQGGLGKAILHALWTFIRTYIIRLGFLEGREGFMLAVSNAEGTYYRYLKLYYYQHNVSDKT